MLKQSSACRKIDVAHIAIPWRGGLSPYQDGDGYMNAPAGSSAAGVGFYPFASAVDGSRDHSQAGNNAALPGTGLAADLLHHAVQEHSFLNAAKQDGPSRGL